MQDKNKIYFAQMGNYWSLFWVLYLITAADEWVYHRG